MSNEWDVERKEDYHDVTKFIMSSGFFLSNLCEEHNRHGCCHFDEFFFEFKFNRTYAFKYGEGVIVTSDDIWEEWHDISLDDFLPLCPEDLVKFIIFNIEIFKFRSDDD